ncbi:dTDP-4-dehydrorhamnose reductase [Shewanella kaireitica]|uniref:dTDP-4-dehydrorhamnose reductase n=1 Tax=Shewanella kaireitica TaxID=212021 RepID=UPI00200DE414|nr:dTDP-4-dehydrorhamnose reductase [Shewanella kaireitica]MCL1095761.1 dTDP-4-dehydrorhamnose reductase [Shewanella kaireitica]
MQAPIKIMVTGGNGQLAQSLALIAHLSDAKVKAGSFTRITAEIMHALVNILPEVSNCLSEQDELYLLSHRELDICDSVAIDAAFKQVKPDVVINSAAYNAVDNAETDSESAFKVNVEGPKLLAERCKRDGVMLVHISSDFVFSGEKSSAYNEQDTPAPLSVYGKSKLAGELAVRQVLAEQAYIIRTSWLYSCQGDNFVHTMQKLFAAKEQVSVIADQYGSPTWSEALAVIIFKLIKQKEVTRFGAYLGTSIDANFSTQFTGQSVSDSVGFNSLFHYAAANSCSWLEFAQEIQRLVLVGDKSKKAHCNIRPISTLSWQAGHEQILARRPKQSALNNQRICQQLGLREGSLLKAKWQLQLKGMLDFQKIIIAN